MGRATMVDQLPAKVYAILHVPSAFEDIQHANAAAQPLLTHAIYQLQNNPRPDGREPADEYVQGVSSIIVRSTSPH